MTTRTSPTEYSAALTGEAFLFPETRTLSRLLIQGEEVEDLYKRTLAENLILHKKVGSLKRVTPPIFRRLSAMTPRSLQAFAEGDVESAKLILLVAIAKTDRLVRDFLLDIYADKVGLKATKIDKADIERYFESVYAATPHLRDRSDQTKAKLKQQLMKIFAEAGLVKKQGTAFLMMPPHITNTLANRLVADGDSLYISALGGQA